MSRGRLLFVFNNPAFFRSHRWAVALAAAEAGWAVHVASPDGPGREEIAGRFPWHELSLAGRHGGPAAALRAMRQCDRLIRTLDPALVECATIQPNLVGGLVTRRRRIPTVAWVPGLGHAFTGSRALRTVALAGYRVAWGGRRPLRVLCENAADRAELLAHRVARASQLVVAPGSGVDLERFVPTPLPSGEPVVLLAGRMLREKGVHEFVQAIDLLAGSGTPCRGVLAGEPDPRNPSRLDGATLRAWSDAGRVEWIGHVADMPALLARATIVCLPSWREGRPQVLMEAAATGRPVVASDIPGCRAVVAEGETGVLVPPHDPAALANAIGGLLRDPARLAAMGQEAARRARGEFGHEAVVRSVLPIYDELVRRRAGTGMETAGAAVVSDRPSPGQDRRTSSEG